MQFKHPEILYFLFLLLIPILVHLFQLRRFKTQYFTNVKLLRQLQQQTRKSKSIKKWLLLATRLLLLAFLIIAFAQPFFDAKNASDKNNELVVLLDTSFSMQAKGNKGELLKRSIQEILENFPENQTFSLVTNTATFWDISAKSIKNELLDLKYTSVPFELDFLLTQIDSKKPNSKKDYIIISDGIDVSSKKLEELNKNNKVFFYETKAENKNNISIDEVKISQVLDTFYEITISLSLYGEYKEAVTLGVYNAESLIAKTQISFTENKKTVKINIPKKEFHGKITIEDGSLNYDNSYYFSITEPKKQPVMAIGSLEKNNFLNRIITSEDFNFTVTELNQVNYNEIENQQCIILNELEEIPQALTTNLIEFYKKGGAIVYVPNANANAQSSTQFLKQFGALQFLEQDDLKKQITTIHFSHPIFKNVFEKKISNFQYPEVNQSFSTSGQLEPILSYNNQSPFLGMMSNKIGKLYVFTAGINKKNSNFQNSPLIVPVFFNMAKNSGISATNTFTIGTNEAYLLEASLSKDEVVSVTNSDYSFIPSQQILNKKVKINFGDYPELAGNYQIQQKNSNLQALSFNYARTESDLTQTDNATFANTNTISNLENAINQLLISRTDTVLWKWFLLLTLLFLVFEIIIQKFFK